jgi:hypothetical protein
VSSWSDGELFILIAAFVLSQYACHRYRVIPQAFPADRKAKPAQRSEAKRCRSILSTRCIAALEIERLPWFAHCLAVSDGSALQCKSEWLYERTSTHVWYFA